MQMEYLSLGELASLIRSAIQSTLNDEYWIIAEIAQIKCHSTSGHCYLDLVEKSDDTVTAQMRATIWARDYMQIKNYFQTITGQEIQAGMKVLIQARVLYHEVYGLSLNIRDIDPRYTLGEMALRRRQVIEQLTREGIIDMNRRIDLPPVMQRIAVISSLTAAGYGDFIDRLQKNPYGYRFSYILFQSYVQGQKADESIRDAMRACMRIRDRFDAIAIIRGGGSIVDLHCFDSYPLARDIALSPLPVFTGIGHEKDETVADRVAHMRLITPTAVAEFFISRAKMFEDSIDTMRHRLISRTHMVMQEERHHLRILSDNLTRRAKNFLQSSFVTLTTKTHLLQTGALTALRAPVVSIGACEGKLIHVVSTFFTNRKQVLQAGKRVLNVHPRHILFMQSRTLEHVETKIRLLDPQNVLRRGYSLTFHKGKVLQHVNQVRRTDIIATKLHHGTITSVVEGVQEDNREQAEEAHLCTGDAGTGRNYPGNRGGKH